MIRFINSLLAPFISLILMMLGSGLFNTFSSIRLEIEGYSTATIGAVTSALYVGILVGSLYLSQWIAKVGHIRSFILFAAVSTLLTLSQAIWIDPFYWSAIRFLSGICMAGVFIVIESWILIQSPMVMRGRVLSVYLAVFYSAMSLGQFLINIASIETIYPFCIAAFLFAISALPIQFQIDRAPPIVESERLSLLELFKISPIGFLGGMISGMLLAAVYGLVPVYAKTIGMEISEIGILMAVIIFGGLSFQWPLGVWADRGNRNRVLNFSACMASLFALIIALLPAFNYWVLLIISWVFGGFAFTIYPLSMGFTCAKISDDKIVSATGGFVLAYGLGAISGPLLAPIAMSVFGVSGLFYFLSAITLFLGVSGFKVFSAQRD